MGMNKWDYLYIQQEKWDKIDIPNYLK